MFPNYEFKKPQIWYNLFTPSCTELAEWVCCTELLWAVVSTSHNTILCLSCSLEQLCLVISVFYLLDECTLSFTSETMWENEIIHFHSLQHIFYFFPFTPIPGKQQAVLTNCGICYFGRSGFWLGAWPIFQEFRTNEGARVLLCDIGQINASILSRVQWRRILPASVWHCRVSYVQGSEVLF